jgi:hypothetical protein
MCVILHLACDFYTHVCDSLSHAFDFYTYACAFDILRVKILFYNVYRNLSYRHMPAAHMRAESTLCATL